MTKRIADFFLFVCFLSLAHGQKFRSGEPQPKARPGDDFPVRVHISGIRLFTQCDGGGLCMDVLRIDALLNDKKAELSGNFGLLPKQLRAEIVPGSNHQARLWKDTHTMGGTLMFQNYQLVFPDRSTWLCVVSGISE